MNNLEIDRIINKVEKDSLQRILVLYITDDTAFIESFSKKIKDRKIAKNSKNNKDHLILRNGKIVGEKILVENVSGKSVLINKMQIKNDPAIIIGHPSRILDLKYKKMINMDSFTTVYIINRYKKTEGKVLMECWKPTIDSVLQNVDVEIKHE